MLRPSHLRLLPIFLAALAAASAYASLDDKKSLLVRGRTVDPEGFPVAGVRVSIAGTRRVSVTSDAAGQYELPVPLGTPGDLRRAALLLTIRAERKGWRFALPGGDRVLGLEVQLTAGEEGTARCVAHSNDAGVAAAAARAFGLDGEAVGLSKINFIGVKGDDSGEIRNPALPQTAQVAVAGVTPPAVEAPAAPVAKEEKQVARRPNPASRPAAAPESTRVETRANTAPMPPEGTSKPAVSAAREPASPNQAERVLAEIDRKGTDERARREAEARERAERKAAAREAGERARLERREREAAEKLARDQARLDQQRIEAAVREQARLDRKDRERALLQAKEQAELENQERERVRRQAKEQTRLERTARERARQQAQAESRARREQEQHAREAPPPIAARESAREIASPKTVREVPPPPPAPRASPPPTTRPKPATAAAEPGSDPQEERKGRIYPAPEGGQSRARAKPLVIRTPGLRPDQPRAGDAACECHIEGTVEVRSDEPLKKRERIAVSLTWYPALSDTVELFMGSPRHFELPPAPCGPQRLKVVALSGGRFTAVSREAMAGFRCEGGSRHQMRIVLEPR